MAPGGQAEEDAEMVEGRKPTPVGPGETAWVGGIPREAERAPGVSAQCRKMFKL